MKILIIGDAHFGEKGDSSKHNQQLLDFIDHVCEKHADEVETVIQLGDWFHHRSKVATTTLNRGIEGAKKLSETFGKENVYVLTGNHDIALKHSLEESSLIAIDPYVTVVSKPLSLENCYLTPWIITQEEWDDVVNQGKNHDYLFAHLELSSFYMNDHYVMEHGKSGKELRDYKQVITGHYHSKQEQGNILYLGTPIPMSQNEANRDMGYMILDTDTGDMEFIVYDKVKVVSIPYDELEATISTLDPENTSIRVVFPDDLEDETVITDVTEVLMEMNFSDVKTKYTGNKAQKLLSLDVEEVEEVENIDATVIHFIKNATLVEGIDTTTLESLYLVAKEQYDDQV